MKAAEVKTYDDFCHYFNGLVSEMFRVREYYHEIDTVEFIREIGRHLNEDTSEHQTSSISWQEKAAIMDSAFKTIMKYDPLLATLQIKTFLLATDEPVLLNGVRQNEDFVRIDFSDRVKLRAAYFKNKAEKNLLEGAIRLRMGNNLILEMCYQHNIIRFWQNLINAAADYIKNGQARINLSENGFYMEIKRHADGMQLVLVNSETKQIGNDVVLSEQNFISEVLSEGAYFFSWVQEQTGDKSSGEVLQYIEQVRSSM